MYNLRSIKNIDARSLKMTHTGVETSRRSSVLLVKTSYFNIVHLLVRPRILTFGTPVRIS